MPLPPSLCKSFYAWARPKLRPLVEAHSADKKAGIKRYGSFNKLLLEYYDEFEQQPFAQPDFEEYLDEDGEPTMDVTTIRERAEQWLRNHARTSKSVQLAKFEADGGVSERSQSRAKSAAELWAEDKKPSIRKATCEHLGIPVTTGNNALPPEYIGARKTVVAREFALLPQADQDEWIALAREEKESAAKDLGSVISIQERQMSFAPWLDSMLGKRVKGGPLGDTFFMQFTGYCVRARDRQLERFRGQIDSGNSPNWFTSEAFREVVGPAWTEFIHKDVADKVVAPLTRLPGDATDDELKQARVDLTAWFETMFRLACDFDSLDVKAFWRDVADDPEKFVIADRLPEGVGFANPKYMAEDDFCELYKHIWRCQHKPTTVERDSLFIYEPDAVREYVTLERVQHLRRQQERRTRKAAARAAAGNTAASAQDAGKPGAPASGQDDGTTASGTVSDSTCQASTSQELGAAAATAPAAPAAATAPATPVASDTSTAPVAPTTPATPAVPEDNEPTPADPAAMQVDAADSNTGAAISGPTPSSPLRDATPAIASTPPPKARADTRRGRAKATASTKTARTSPKTAKPPTKTATGAAVKTTTGSSSKTSVAKGAGKAGTKRRAEDSEDESGEEDADGAPLTSKSKERLTKKLRVEPGPKADKPRYATRRKAEGTK